MKRVLLFALLVCLPAYAAVTVSVNGSNYSIPQVNERGWGTNVTTWIQAISAATLQKSGGTFTLTADADFGASFGLKSAYYKSRSANISTSGILRLSNTESVGWRNSANNANLLLTPNASSDGVLQYNSVDLVGTSLTQTLTNKKLSDSTTTVIDEGDATKIFKLQASSITTGNTRTATVPDRDFTFNLGTDISSGAATNGQVLTANGSAGSAWITPASEVTAQTDIKNCSLATSVGSNAMTIALKDAAGSDPSAGSPCKVAFRNATAATGTYTVVSYTAATSVVIPSGGTGGHLDGVDGYFYVLAINNSGTGELAYIGSRYDLDEGSIISTTTAGSGSDDWNTAYSNTGRSNVGFRILARIKSNQTTAGTYASNATEISLYSGYVWPDGTSRKNNLTWSFAGLGTTTNHNFWYRRDKDTMIVYGSATLGTVAASTMSIELPSGYTIDTSKMAGSTSNQHVGRWHQLDTSTQNTYSNNEAGVLFFDGSDNDSIFITDSVGTSSGTFDKQNGNATFNSNAAIVFEFQIPIARWRSN